MNSSDDLTTLVEQLDHAISRLTEFRIANELPEPAEYDSIETDSFGQLIDKLLVVHIRYWNLENEMSESLSDTQLVEKRKLSEPLFKVWRPMLVRALDKRNANILNSLRSGKPDIFSQLPKSYKGWTSKDT